MTLRSATMAAWLISSVWSGWHAARYFWRIRPIRKERFVGSVALHWFLARSLLARAAMVTLAGVIAASPNYTSVDRAVVLLALVGSNVIAMLITLRLDTYAKGLAEPK